MSDRRRIVITGVGAVSSVGHDVETFWSAVKAGENGIRQFQEYVDAGMKTTIAGRVVDFDAAEVLGDRKYARQTDPFVHFAMAATAQAIATSGLDNESVDKDRVGCIIGAGIGGMNEIEDGAKVLHTRGPGRISPFFIPKLMLNAAAGNIAIKYGFTGPNFATASACTSANHAVGMALRTIQYGEADVIVTGGAESACTPLGMAGFCSARAMSTRNDDPAHASRPFDRDRDGFVMGDGAGILVFEEIEHAKARGAEILAEVIGFGMSDDAFHMTSPSEDGKGACKSMENALKDSRINPEDVTYVNAHGTSTEYNDKTETLAIKKTFGDHAKKLMVSSTKSMIGHLLGASGAVELVATVMGIKDGFVPPTRNHDNPSEGLDLDYVPHEAREHQIDVAISNSFGFGGHNATIAVKRFS
ncbi:MAG: beta-ketoacyl-ACP synthase II [Planctomycetota bacterium]|jgi:3-oxoacyl-[acyl-carrier-protein] synthase II